MNATSLALVLLLMRPQSGCMDEDQATQAFFELMYRHADERAKRFDDGKTKIAHYTTAENAINIISGKTLWLRNAAVMNDFLEISYGRDCVTTALKGDTINMSVLLNDKHPGLAEEVITWLGEVEYAARNHTYLTSFAEHDAEDRLGKLSMWRAYGGPVAGAAIIFNAEVFQSDNDQLNVFAHPVTYGADEFASLYYNMMRSIFTNQDLLGMVPRDRAKSVLFHALRDLMLTTKHQGFREEEEWRIIHSPFLFSSAFVQPIVRSPGGVPQVVYTMKLEDQPGLNMPELNLNDLIYRVIIGPCQHPEQVAHAIDTELVAAGVQNASQRIVCSDIPLRQRG